MEAKAEILQQEKVKGDWLTMTNYEKYKDQIDWQARAGSSLAVRKSDNTPTMCEEINCNMRCIKAESGV